MENPSAPECGSAVGHRRDGKMVHGGIRVDDEWGHQ